MRPWVMSTSPGVAMREKPAWRPPDSVCPRSGGLGRLVGLEPPGALLHQFGGHFAPPFNFLTSPTTPLGKNSVTPMNSRPRKYNQNSG